MRHEEAQMSAVRVALALQHVHPGRCGSNCDPSTAQGTCPQPRKHEALEKSDSQSVTCPTPAKLKEEALQGA